MGRSYATPIDCAGGAGSLMPGNPMGDEKERDLVNELDAAGYAVMRAPSSGSATSRELPDCVAGNDGHFVAIEAKYSSGGPIYLKRKEIEGLGYFSKNFGARPLIAVTFAARYGDPPYGNDDDNGWRFFDPDDPSLHVTDAGSVRVKKEDAYADGMAFDELFGPEVVADGGFVSPADDDDDDDDDDTGVGEPPYKSGFHPVFGYSTACLMIDAMLELDEGATFTKRDLSQYAGVGQASVYRHFETFLELNMVTEVRREKAPGGGTDETYYAFNPDSPVSQGVIRLAQAVRNEVDWPEDEG